MWKWRAISVLGSLVVPVVWGPKVRPVGLAVRDGARLPWTTKRLVSRQSVAMNGAPHDADSYKAMVERLKTTTGLKGKALFMPLRLAVTGSDHGPELVRVIPLLQRASESDPSVLSPLARAEKLIG